MVLASILGVAAAVSASAFPLEWNVTYETDAPYEVELQPRKLGFQEDDVIGVRADGRELPSVLLPGKAPGSVRLRFRVPRGTKRLDCVRGQGSCRRALVGSEDNLFDGVLKSAKGWTFPRGEIWEHSDSLEFLLERGMSKAVCEVAVPDGAAGRDVQFEIEVENNAKLPLPSDIYIEQRAADGRLLAETANDPRWTSHLRPTNVRQRMVNPGHLHPEVARLRLVLSLACSGSEWDVYGECAPPAVRFAGIKVSALSLRVGTLLPFPRYADENFAPGVTGEAGDCALRLGGDRRNAVWYQTRSWASWARAASREAGASALREEKLVFFPAGAGTCEAWLKPAWSEKETHKIFLFSGKRQTSRYHIANVDSAFDVSYVPASHTLSFCRTDVTGKAYRGQVEFPLPCGTWFHLAATWEPGACATVWVDGVPALRVDLKGFQPLDLKTARYPADEDVMELYLGSESQRTRRSPSLLPSASRPHYCGDVDNWRVSSGVRYSKPFTPSKTLAVDADTRAFFDFDRTFVGRSGGGFAWIPLTFLSAGDRVDHRVRTPAGEISYYPDEIAGDADPRLVLNPNSYSVLPTDADFRAARRPRTRSFRARTGETLSLQVPEGTVADFVEIRNDGAAPLACPFVVGNGEVDPRSFGDIRDSLFGSQDLSDRARANRIFQFVISASDYFMTHSAYFPFAGGDACGDVWFQALSVLNSYCGFECGPLNNIAKNLFACSGGLPATMTQGYAHSFEQVFYEGKNHVYDLSAQSFFPAFDNETPAELGELDDQPGAMVRLDRSCDHFIRNGERVDHADAAAFVRRQGFTLYPGEAFRAWWDNDGEVNDLLCSKMASGASMKVFSDYTDRVHADRKSTRYPVYRVHRYFPHYGNAFFVFEGRPSASNPAFEDAGESFVYHVRSPYPVVAAEYVATCSDGTPAAVEISTDGGRTYRPLPAGFLRYEVRARYDYLLRVRVPMTRIAWLSLTTEVQHNARIMPGRVRPGRNDFILKGQGESTATVTFGWREPGAAIDVDGAMYSGVLPGAETSLLVCDPSAGPARFAVRGVSTGASVRTAGRLAAQLDARFEKGELVVSAARGTRGFGALVVCDGDREKPFDVLVCEGVRTVHASDFKPLGAAHRTPAGDGMVQEAIVLERPGATAAAPCRLPSGRFAILPLFRVAAGNRDGRFTPRLDLELGGVSLPCARAVNSACNYYKALYGKEGGRANWKWDYPLRPDCRYYLEQMLVSELVDPAELRVTYRKTAPAGGVELAAVLLVPDPDEDLHGDLIKTLCGVNTQRARVSPGRLRPGNELNGRKD